MEHETTKAFVYCNNWYDDKFKAHASERYHTTKLALNLFVQMGGRTIVETGTTRQADDWGAGMSTLLFATTVEWLRGLDPHYDGSVWSVDISGQNVSTCQRILVEKDLLKHCCVLNMDSLAFLDMWDVLGKGMPIDLLYLDSVDFPLVAADGPPGPPQEHCLRELELSMDYIHDRTVIMIDDNNFPLGGKPLLAKELLVNLGWTCLFDHQQTVWIKR